MTLNDVSEVTRGLWDVSDVTYGVSEVTHDYGM